MRKLETIRHGDKFKNVKGEKFLVEESDNLYYLTNIDTGEIVLNGLAYDYALATIRYDGTMSRLSRLKNV